MFGNVIFAFKQLDEKLARERFCFRRQDVVGSMDHDDVVHHGSEGFAERWFLLDVGEGRFWIQG